MNHKAIGLNTVIYVTEPDQIDKSAIKLLNENGFVTTDALENINANQVCGLFVRTYTKVNTELLSHFKNLKYIIRAGVGLDNIDLIACRQRNIKVFNAPGSNKSAVAEYILAMSIFTLRQFPHQIKRISQGLWRDINHPSYELTNRVIGLIGCGNVGRDFVHKLKGFDVTLLGYDPYVSTEKLSSIGVLKLELVEVLSKADIVVIMLPLTKETNNLINQSKINLMKKESIIINVSRGEIVDSKALIESLKHKKISSAILDVIEGEPEVSKIYQNVPNLILTPHIAGFSVESNQLIAINAVKNFLKQNTI